MIALQNRACVHVTFLSAAESAKEIVDLVQLRRDHIMVIVAPGVARDSSGCSLYNRGPACHAEALRRRVCHISLKVIQRHDDDRSRAWQNLLWITAFFFAALHVTHFSRRTLRSEERRVGKECRSRVWLYH